MDKLFADRNTSFQAVLVEIIGKTDRIFPIETGEAKACRVHVDGPEESLKAQIVNAIES
jgi:aerobic-type carbon monoxide dehydrogenase small subunit (CoxS/CutS family)